MNLNPRPEFSLEDVSRRMHYREIFPAWEVGQPLACKLRNSALVVGGMAKQSDDKWDANLHSLLSAGNYYFVRAGGLDLATM